jgi:hypothetical protein
MRAFRRFPPPDSHVSLSAVLEPGPNPQPAPPPRPTTGQSNLPQNRGAPHRKPISTDTPRHQDPPQLRSGPLTSLADKPPLRTLSAPSSSLRPQGSVQPPKRPTSHDNPTTLKTTRTAPQSLAFQRAPRPAK